jgi:glycosyltransferase involved in cell wall biosynthesis
LGAPSEKGVLTSRIDDAVIFIDATGTLQSLGIAPTGIPRVEEAIVRCALADADPRVSVVRYDRRLRAFRLLSEGERREILSHADILPMSGPDGRPDIRQVLGSIARNPRVSRDADRYFAELASGSKRQGLSYQSAKLLFRSWRLLQLFVASFVEKRSLEARGAIPSGGIVLLSNTMLLGPRLNAALRRADRAAFICHDLIPIVAPRFAVDTQHVRRFADNIETAMRVCATVLCTSKTSQEMAADYCQSLRIEPPPLLRFPMPSILHEKAEGLSPVASRIPSPFILYCSTIEVRKNHLMLARIWLRALKEGVDLPMLVCAGKWGWGVDELEEFFAQHPELSDRVIFTGPVADAPLIDLYRRAEFGVIPSFIEGWGYSASECLDFGVPVVVSNTPALREATHGIMPSIDADDEERWYREIRRMSEDAPYRAELRCRITKKHRPVAAAESWAAVKNALLEPDLSEISVEPRPTNAERNCAITVAVTTTDSPLAVLPRLERLSEQARRNGGELILVSGAAGTDFNEPNSYGARVHCLPGRTIFECRATALELASSDLVALTEDHCEHPDDWCSRILQNYADHPRLVLLGGAVANGSAERIDDLMNYWMTFGAFAPGQVIAHHPCVAQFVVRKSALKLPLQPGDLESSIIQKFEKVRGAVHVDPLLCVRHVQSHGLRNTLTIHFHNGRATAGLSPRRAGGANLSHLRALRYSWSDAKAHFRTSAAAFMRGTESAAKTAGYLTLILPLLVMHAAGEYVGYRYGPGSSARHLV